MLRLDSWLNCGGSPQRRYKHPQQYSPVARASLNPGPHSTTTHPLQRGSLCIDQPRWAPSLAGVFTLACGLQSRRRSYFSPLSANFRSLFSALADLQSQKSARSPLYKSTGYGKSATGSFFEHWSSAAGLGPKIYRRAVGCRLEGWTRLWIDRAQN